MEFNFLIGKIMGNNTLKSMIAGAVIATSQAPADTPNINSATSVAVRESGIDFKSKIAQIDVQIVQIQTKIDLLLQKNNLSKNFKEIVTLKKEKKKLTAEKLAIIDNRIENKKETVAIKQTEEKQIDKQLSIADHKLAALERVSKVLNK